jgi:predicted RNase H-like HicB family nuclease
MRRVVTQSRCLSFQDEGDTWEEAIANAKEAIAGYIGALKDLGKPIPLEIPVEVNAESIL